MVAAPEPAAKLKRTSKDYNQVEEGEFEWSDDSVEIVTQAVAEDHPPKVAHNAPESLIESADDTESEDGDDLVGDCMLQ